MRHSRRLGHGSMEFASSGEDSFVAVVVTKLTGALLFILLLAMVIMALLPKAIDLPSADKSANTPAAQLEITTPETLPEAISGRPYAVALAASGGSGPLRWAVDGKLPEGLTFDPETAQIRGTPKSGTPEPVELVVRVSDGSDRTARRTALVVFEPDRPLTLPSKFKPGLPPLPWRSWLEQGFGFLILALIHMVGMSTVGSLQRWSLAKLEASPDAELELGALRRRFFLYRWTVRLATLSAVSGLALWLWVQRP